MTTNVGSIDRIVRIIAGLALLAWALIWPGTSGYSWIGYIGIVPILTAVLGWCPAYTLVGLNTCPVKRA